jgi:hypothetical protein
LILAANEYGDADLTGWWAGLIIGFLVVLVVVIVVAALLSLASRIGAEAGEAVDLLEQTRRATQPLPGLIRTNETLQSILRGAVTARQALGG